MRRALPLLLAVLALGLLALFDLRRAGDGAMQPSVMPGDWLLLGPGEPQPGDLVRLPDPADPSATVLRRVLARGPATLRYAQGVLRVDGEPLRYREMGRGEGHFVLSERNGWLIRHRERAMLEPELERSLQPGELWLMADDRDHAVDSRWWGPVPTEAAQGRVWLRLGSSDAWRGALTLFGVDGPWLPPSKQPGGA
ncbi:MAG: signal peptidase I [Alphaproteobacteria bacterium]|nr:signal peptidase I [Alphaproteobacteria bacterium]